MRFPVGTGTKEDFEKYWYIAQGFGNPTTYGFHEGADINIKTGGDTDLGQPIYAIAEGDKEYYHFNTHPTTGFGIHFAYKITGAWGVRWVHCTHVKTDSPIKDKSHFPEGEKLSEIGKSGTWFAHLHFSIFKVDPATLPQKLDTIAKTTAQLNDWWEDPIPFIIKWASYVPPQQEEGFQLVHKGQILATYDNNPQDTIAEQSSKIESLSKSNATLTQDNAIFSSKVTQLENDNAELVAQLREATNELGDCKLASEPLLKQLAVLEAENTSLKEQLKLKDPTEGMSMWQKFQWLIGR